ncbi:MAG: hypothetical protein Q4C39_03160 [Clostridia bacterium]|jgi:uncharacterized membrane protein|nr:hypothetical protein [Clostridia bacterium]MDO4382053.1 hypothetical protein [Clostridia bacterium]HCF65509.1 hypothetical protein [Clostridiales bacterium]
MRNVFTYFMLFFIYAILGWIIETTLVSIEKRKFVNRGFLIGPYCPIYGFGGLAITILLKNYTKDPIVLFLMAVIICGTLEYFTSYIMEKIFKARWWDYSAKKYNINGRICLETVVPFGILGCLVMYVLNPITFKYLNMLSNSMLNIISAICFTIFITDNIVSYNVISSFTKTVKTINVGKIKDNTEEITKKVREVLIGKSFFNKRLMEAYPNLQAKIKEKARQIAQKAKEVKTEMSDKVESMKEKITQSASEIKDNIGDKVEEMQKEIRKKPSKKEGK